jgi:hypothetical protein
MAPHEYGKIENFDHESTPEIITWGVLWSRDSTIYFQFQTPSLLASSNRSGTITIDGADFNIINLPETSFPLQATSKVHSLMIISVTTFRNQSSMQSSEIKKLIDFWSSFLWCLSSEGIIETLRNGRSKIVLQLIDGEITLNVMTQLTSILRARSTQTRVI